MELLIDFLTTVATLALGYLLFMIIVAAGLGLLWFLLVRVGVIRFEP